MSLSNSGDTATESSGEMSDEDQVVVTLGRRLRACCAVEYDRFLRLAVKSLQLAEMRQAKRRDLRQRGAGPFGFDSVD